ncbi:MAG: SAM-dependent methyltransferase [Verrucomicrobia bacterium]|nr:SAM-dependent methyltransferase [Verrucomicrobiota bacterium]
MNVATAKLKPAPRQSLSVVEAPLDDLERRRELGQFFTSPEVAGFIWDLLEVIHGRRFSADTRLIDPACGEGVFLRVARERGGLPAKNLFGADIDATLDSGWQRDPLLRGANVHLVNGLLDDPTSGIEAGTFNIAAGNPPFSGKGLRDLLRLLEESETARHEEQDFFEAACLREEPPSPRQPLSRQERAELERMVRTLSQYSCWRLETEPEPDEEAEAESASAPTELFAASVLCDRRRPTASDLEQAAQLIARWAPNRPLDTSRPEIRDTIRRLASTAIEVMFTERFVRLAKPGGLIALIVPESIVASDRLGRFRIWLLGKMDLLASISLPQKVFTGVGANAKTSIVFARRLAQDRVNGWYSPEALAKLPDDDQPIFMAAPRVDAPGFTVENYLARVLADARRDREIFWPTPK